MSGRLARKQETGTGVFKSVCDCMCVFLTAVRGGLATVLVTDARYYQRYLCPNHISKDSEIPLNIVI